MSGIDIGEVQKAYRKARHIPEPKPRRCAVRVTMAWDGEASEDADAIHLCRRVGDIVDWDVTWLDEEETKC